MGINVELVDVVKIYMLIKCKTRKYKLYESK